MAKVKVTWKTMQDSRFIPARTFDIPMPRRKHQEAGVLRDIAASADKKAPQPR